MSIYADAYQVLDSRARCPKCGCFVAWSSLSGEDYIDPGAYYGIGSTEWTDCPRCGQVEGIDIAPTKFRRLDPDDARDADLIAGWMEARP